VLVRSGSEDDTAAGPLRGADGALAGTTGALLKALGIEDKRATVVVADDDVNAFLSFRNLPKVRVIGASEANAHNLIDNGALVLSEAIASNFGEVLA
jgi:large subunit ribosomal protein L4